MGFRRRLGLFLIVTLIAVQAVTAFFALGVLRHNAIEQGKRELKDSTVVFMRQLDLLSERVADEVNILALDYALRGAIANGDSQTILSALRNHGRRVGATRMVLVKLDGTIEEDTIQNRDVGGPFPLNGLIKAAADSQKATALAALDGRIYWIVAVPVNAPLPIAFIAACVPIDNALLDKLKDLSSFPNSVALATLDRAGWRVIASTNGYRPVIHAPAADKTTARAEIVDQAGGPALTWTAALNTAPESVPVIAVLDYPLSDALHIYRDVITSMVLVLAGALILGLFGAMLIARGISQPVEALAASARRIAAGDYAPVPPIKQGGEIGALSADLGTMAIAIAQRETDLKRTVDEVEVARDEAVRANEAKSQFLANMSHELRTPLNAILGFSEVMRDEIMGPLGSATYSGYARDIYESGKHLLALVEEMLDLARVEAGTFEIADETVKLADVFQSSLTMLGGPAQEGGVELRVECEPSAWPTLRGDARKLTQAISNVIHNATKFTPAGGCVTISGEAHQDRLRLRIADTGIGIRAEDLPIVVKPFQRLSSAFDGKYQGAGLGLPFAKAVVELHNGTLTITSKPGAGTTVTIELPLAPAMSKRRMTSAA